MAKSCCESKSTELDQLREKQRNVLVIVLIINFVMFLIEFSYGILSKSTALLSDSLDMLGDATVYAFSLYVINKGLRWKAKAALLKGLIITLFGLYVLGEATYKALNDVLPAAQTMGVVGVLALIANSACLALLLKHREDDINMKSTWICSRNDIVANTGVLIAAALVYYFQSKWPDIIVGLIIALVFLKSAFSILSESISVYRDSNNDREENR
ncbi:putative integral membrane protein [Halobacteriovorax marinus SJ]|uniref:Integral membrane protein n=1 Tax=Halobacteriovorax marinus (strain ATCC BAA-682 / DSM 15412 / SJ) TaxID=862908 RepID=E1X4K0_HALMS|nr:cation diffusion facilitator family transporter [Halobacteriovorax marinus]CBW25430.1 putative integral membrane protein [Halobacteriovorax marinus SJ]